MRNNGTANYSMGGTILGTETMNKAGGGIGGTGGGGGGAGGGSYGGGTLFGTDQPKSGGSRALNSSASTFLNQQKGGSNGNNGSGKDGITNNSNGTINGNNGNNGSNGNGNLTTPNSNKSNPPSSNKGAGGKMIRRAYLFSDDPTSIEVAASEGDQALIM